ncbi:MAG: amidohydrolase family protein, partial [Bacteroidaceae bacterium]|nr:amidohydrolase family protein [Bacteroidaceae bacterium]
TIKVTNEFGLRATIGLVLMDSLPTEKIEKAFHLAENGSPLCGDKIQFALAPHAIYTVGKKLFTRAHEVAKRCGLKYHVHISETEQEVRDCLSTYGMTPVRLLHKWGVLDENTVLAHAVHVDYEEMKIMSDCGVTVAHCPCSNMKLGSGIFPTSQMLDAGVRVTIGTDGSSSNNNLSMLEEMKISALLAKTLDGPEVLTVDEVLAWGTVNAAKAYNIDSGEIAEGKLADAILINLNDERMLPNHHLLSNWVYAADSRVIHSVLCDGRFVQRNGHVDGEEDIIRNFKTYFQNRRR